MNPLVFPKPFVKSKTKEWVNDQLLVYNFLIRSTALRKKMKVDVYVPANFRRFPQKTYPTLLLNDGQDAEQLHLIDTLTRWYEEGNPPIAVVTIHANEERLNEYGVPGFPDYASRGAKAQLHERFTLRLVEFFRNRYGLFKEPRLNVFAGFSLGGLSAMAIAWNQSHIFRKVGIFSGSFWWRSKPFIAEDPDGNRIMHEIIRESKSRIPLKFWFEVGTRDEESDRNGNGVIDAIDDTLDIIKELKAKGYPDEVITYLQLEGGEHNFHTWSGCFPEFLEWAFLRS